MPECKLRVANARPGVGCDGEACLYWRSVEQVGPDVVAQPRECAIQHFRMLEGGAGIATWLWSVKQRVESGDRDPSVS
jgi:hypothetical protein